ncbi:hypothetical protein HDE_04743 [Halotydeus destructor]|nr:hypothetical protein HDE_04743 [Halotydeus destructor]
MEGMFSVYCCDRVVPLRRISKEEGVEKYETVGIFYPVVFSEESAIKFNGTSAAVLAMYEVLQHGTFVGVHDIYVLVEVFTNCKLSMKACFKQLQQETETLILQRVSGENAAMLMHVNHIHGMDMFKPLNLLTDLERSIDNVVANALHSYPWNFVKEENIYGQSWC